MNDNWRDDPDDAANDDSDTGHRQEQVRRPSDGPNVQHLITAAFIAIGQVIAFVMAQHAVIRALIFILILLALVLSHESAHFATRQLFGRSAYRIVGKEGSGAVNLR